MAFASTIPALKKKVTKDNVEKATMVATLPLDEQEATFNEIQTTVSKTSILIKEINMGLSKINFN